MGEGNREYKSDVFSMLMSIPEYALSVYNVINKSNYTDPNDVEMCKLEDKGLSLTVRNDASFILDATLNLYEHQSTVCPNMPLRSLVYFSLIIQDIIAGKNIYGSKLISIPLPKFVVFYNGVKEQPDQYVMNLSDAYTKKTQNPDLELRCTVYNINHGHNQEMLKGCEVLDGYAKFVQYIRDYLNEGYVLISAIELAIDRCISEKILAEFFQKNRAEVVKVTKLDYTFERQIEMEREDARADALEEGRAEGLEKGRAKGLEEGRAKGLEEGREEAEQRYSELVQCLIKDNRIDDLQKITVNKLYRLQLFEEYRL